MFDEAHPAADILTLCKALEAEHAPAHIYRGQTRYFTPCVPSAFRPFALAPQADGWVPLASIKDKPVAGIEYERERYEIKDRLARTFDRGMTNVLAQQYGLTSDMLDVSASVGIAAFFATRQWPTFEPFVPRTSADRLGVVYRMRCTATPPDVDTFSSAMEDVYLLLETGQKVFFENARTLSSEAEAVLGDEGRFRVLSREFPEGFQIVNLLKMPFYCHPMTIRDVFLERMRRAGMEDLVGRGKTFATLRDVFDSSRAAKQAAGVVSPPLRYQGAISKSVAAEPWKGDTRWLKARPDKAIKSGLNAVFDLNHNPRFEKFFFRHDPAKAVVVDDLDQLWPPPQADPLFDLMMGAVRGFFLEYRGQPGFNALSVLDRGYRAP
jgi:hypothetical protein